MPPSLRAKFRSERQAQAEASLDLTILYKNPYGSRKKELRLQKFLAWCGVASRRACEDLIREGKVAVNGNTVKELGAKVVPESDTVTLDGKIVHQYEQPVYLAVFKPAEVVTTASDPQGRRIVADLLPRGFPRVYPVGRLDYHTTGLVILTNDGIFADYIMHPRNHVPKVYQIKVNRELTLEELTTLQTGVILDGKKTDGMEVFPLDPTKNNYWYEVHIAEGKYRQIRRSFRTLNVSVRKLSRIQIGQITLEGMRIGDWRHIEPQELKSLGYKP